MAATQVKSAQIGDGEVKRADLNVTTSGSAVVAKIVAGTGVTLSSTGPDAGTGDVTISASGGGGGLTNFTEAVNTSSPNATVPVVSLTATNAATDVDVALKPKGAGALTAHVADATSTGGNKRGTQAVDWQMLRGSATQVASGSCSTIGGGYRNTASSNYSTVSGGSNNVASSGSSCAIAGGANNAASANYSCVTGGYANTASGQYATVAGGNTNTASATYSAVLGGSNNTASSNYSAVLAGQVNTATAYCGVVLGRYNTILPTSASITYTATDPALIIGNGTGSTQAARSYSAYITFDSKMFLGGRKTTSDATGTQSATGYLNLGTANSTTFAQITSDAQTSTQTYAIPDCQLDGKIGIRVAVPASSAAAGVPGMWASDDTYFYYYGATGWYRIAGGTF